MNYYDSMQALIGNTPLVRLGNIVNENGVNVFAKLELWNSQEASRTVLGST